MIQSVGKGLFEKSSLPCPLGNSLGSTVISDPAVVAPVVALSFGDGPSTVRSRVGTVIIDPVKGVTSRSLSHIGQKVLKGIPARINCDPATSVARTLVPNSPDHSQPRNVGRSSGLSMSLGAGIPLSGSLIQAPARFSVSAGQVPGRNIQFVSALAPAKPVADCGAVLRSRRSLLNRSQPAECLSGQVFPVVSTSSHEARVPEKWRWSK